MDNGVYITLSKQAALFRDMEVTANNIANVNTTGFNSSHILFTSYLKQDDGRGKMAFAHDISTWRRTESGSFQQTGNSLDVAISGDAYFAVATPLGTRYTRAGNFQLDAEGQLVTPEGYAVLDDGGQPILFTQDDREITIGEAGNIRVDGTDRGTIGMFSFANPQTLKRIGQRLYSATAPAQPTTETRMLQGVLENSNVEPVLEMTHMMDVSRGVTNTAKFIEVMYDLQRKTNTTWSQQG